MLTSDIHHIEATPIEKGKILFHAAAWATLADKVREFDPDVVILVARKMPRLMEALNLELGTNAIYVSDQAIPFVQAELREARVAILDDVWNVGTTMLRARDQVLAAGAKTIRLFALSAKDMGEARKQGVNLILAGSLEGDRYRSLVDSVPRVLKLMSKPYDVDFPVIPCLISAPISSWDDCWSWLKARFGEYAHSTTDAEQISAGFGRASINVRKEASWTIKARLYFDFNSGICNVVPLALAPAVPLENTYPKGSLSEAVFSSLAATLADKSDALTPPAAGDMNGLARVNTFCDSLLFAEAVLASLNGLVQRESQNLFSLDEVSVQFGPAAARRCEAHFNIEYRSIAPSELQDYLRSREKSPVAKSCGLLTDERVVGPARKFLREGLPTLALQALFIELGRVVGADDPNKYSLDHPYNKSQIRQFPYLRLRLGFTFEEIVSLFKENYKDEWGGPSSVELLVSALIDTFIDDGAVVPTFAVHQSVYTRIYRKGEANPRFDEEIARLKFAIFQLNEKDRDELIGRGRTRVAKLNAILSMSAAGSGSGLAPGAFERGMVGILKRSVAENQGGELTVLMLRLGLWP